MSTHPDIFVNLLDIAPDLHLDIRYATSNNLTGRPISGYSSNKAFMIKPAAVALARVQKAAQSQDLDLLIYETFRPLRATQDLIHWAQSDEQSMKAEYYPSIDKKDLFPKGFISFLSTHTRGIAVDLTLVKRTSLGLHVLDMGTAFDFMDERSATEYPYLSSEQKKNRELLCSLMRNEGFENYSLEWWHFTYQLAGSEHTFYDFEII